MLQVYKESESHRETQWQSKEQQPRKPAEIVNSSQERQNKIERREKKSDQTKREKTSEKNNQTSTFNLCAMNYHILCYTKSTRTKVLLKYSAPDNLCFSIKIHQKNCASSRLDSTKEQKGPTRTVMY